MTLKRWRIGEWKPQEADRLAADAGLSLLAARTLCSRGLHEPDAVRAFLQAAEPAEDPCAMLDMDIAAARINRAIEDGQRIAVFGDYDVDGITATALMVQFLQSCGADVICSLPKRDADGYGLSRAAIDNLKRYGAELIVTVDNGISAADEVAYANSLGIDLVVCDHHLPPAQLPAAVAVVDPLREGDKSRYKTLAGVGVALKLAAAVEGCTVEEMLDTWGFLVALGTIADVMPLVGENRSIVRLGLQQLREGASPGINALCERAGLALDELNARDVAFCIAPRLNAAGRMGDPTLALRLVLSDDEEEAAALAEELEQLNAERQKIEKNNAERIAKRIEDDPMLLRAPVLIVAEPELHPGVIGITCSRLAERYGKPVLVLSVDGDTARGSGRSVEGFSLYDAVASADDLLHKYGGHEIAVGVNLAADNIEAFRERVTTYAREHLSSVCTTLEESAVVRLSEASEDIVAGLSVLEPFGNKNEEPVFGVMDAAVTAITPLGERHTRITVRQENVSFSGAMFGIVPEELPFAVGDRVDAAVCLSLYSAGGRRPTVSVRFRDIRPAGFPEQALDSIDAYVRYINGCALSSDERALLHLDRHNVAYVYRRLRERELPHSADFLAFRCPDMLPGRVLAALDVLCELGLAHERQSGGRVMVRVSEVTEKKDLTASHSFCSLSEDVSTT